MFLQRVFTMIYKFATEWDDELGKPIPSALKPGGAEADETKDEDGDTPAGTPAGRKSPKGGAKGTKILQKDSVDGVGGCA